METLFGVFLLLMIIGTPVLAGKVNTGGSPGKSGTSIEATLKITPHWVKTYGWTIDKSVDSELLELLEGTTGTSVYTIIVSKDDGTEEAWVDGEICVANAGEYPTEGLGITADLTDGYTPPVEKLASTLVDISNTPVLNPQEMACYDYRIDIPTTGGDKPQPVAEGTYKVTAHVTITNHGGHPNEPFGPSPKDTTIFISNPLIVHDSATVIDTNGESWEIHDDSSLLYSRNYDCSADHQDNTATITYPDDISSGPSDSTRVTVICHPEGGTHQIQNPVANPNYLVMSTPGSVTVTAKVNPVPELLPATVHVQRLDPDTHAAEDLGQLFDDQTNGDALPGDSIFTNQFQFNEPAAGKIHLRVTASYSSGISPVHSTIFLIDVVSLPAQDEIDTALAITSEASQQFRGLSQQYPRSQAREMVIENLESDPDVQDVALGDDGTTVTITFNSHLETALLTGDENTHGSPYSNQAFVATSIFSSFSQECNHINDKLNENSCIRSKILADQAFDLEEVSNLENYGVVYISTHGGMVNNDVSFMTGERVLGLNSLIHLGDWITGKIIPTGADGEIYWAIKPSYISTYATAFPRSLIVISACNSLNGDSMANAFFSKGAGAYVGYTYTVSGLLARDLDEALFDKLATGETLQQAFNEWTLDERTDPSDWDDTGRHAVYEFRGDGGLTLPKDRIINGKFETGNVAGWTAGYACCGDFTQFGTPGGYAVPIGGNVKEGNYALRLGRWDQIYTGGLSGPPAPGTEPSGYDYIYQDVGVPSSGNPALKFSYNIQTYDTALWDWFDVYIKNPATEANLATVVDHDGKPGSNYGEYWNGGWKDISYDLTPWKGQTVRVWFGDRQDGWGDQMAVFIDDVSLPCT